MTRTGRFFQLAARNLGRHPRRTFASGASLVVGVMALMLLRGFTEGFMHHLREFMVQSKVGGVQVHRAGYLASAQASMLERTMADGPELRARLRAVPGVTAVSGRLAFTGLLSNGRGQVAFVGQGLEPGAEQAVCPRAFDDVVEGERGLGQGALVGQKLVKSLKLGLGAPLTLSSQSPTGRGNALQVVLGGTLLPASPLDAQKVVTVSLAEAQALTGMEGQVTEYALALAEVRAAPRVAEAVRAALGAEFEVHPWGERVTFLRDAIAYLEAAVAFVAALLFLVVVGGIANAQLMGVFERQREIGTALAVGMRRAEVRALFLLEAAVLGVAGAGVGALLGAGAVGAVSALGIPMRYFGFSGEGLLRAQLDLGFTALVVLGTLGAAVVAGWYPAARASKLSPIEALRGR